jgi:hypothetical protein
VENSTLLADQRQLRHHAPGSFPVACGGGILTRRASLDVAHVRSYREGGRPQMSPGDRSVGSRHRRGATRQPPGAGRGSRDPAPLPDRQVSGAVGIAAGQRGNRPALGAGLPTPPPCPTARSPALIADPGIRDSPVCLAYSKRGDLSVKHLGGVMRPAPSACRWAGS